MPAKFLADHCTINWHGTDDDTPPGHSIAIGADDLGTAYMWLFKGDEPTDGAFVGSISIPVALNQGHVAYGRGGGFVGAVDNIRDALARLAERADA